jgi:hypothetical protein
MHTIERLRERARPLARLGCVSIGTVYVLVGALALLALSGRATGWADEDRMVHVVMDLPGGPIVIWTIVVGLAGYVLWRTVEVVTDPYEFGSHRWGIAKRTAIGLGALGYGLIAFSAARIATGNGRTGGGESAEEEHQTLVAQVLAWPAGEWWIGAAGLILAAVGIGQFWLVVREAYTMEIRLEERSRRMRNFIRFLAWYGYSARGVILGVLGYFLVRSAVRHDPEEAGDTDTAFDFIGGGLVGDSAFFLVALGTIAYGVFMYLNAWYYQFEKEPDR